MKNTLVPAAAILATLAAAPAWAGDAAAGHAVFTAKCGVCHSDQPGVKKMGPTLAGVVGRPAGTVPDYHYSPANKNSGLTWDDATLDKYLTSPKSVVPGTYMAFPGLPDDTKRADVIAYLDTLK